MDLDDLLEEFKDEKKALAAKKSTEEDPEAWGVQSPQAKIPLEQRQLQAPKDSTQSLENWLVNDPTPKESQPSSGINPSAQSPQARNSVQATPAIDDDINSLLQDFGSSPMKGSKKHAQ